MSKQSPFSAQFCTPYIFDQQIYEFYFFGYIGLEKSKQMRGDREKMLSIVDTLSIKIIWVVLNCNESKLVCIL